MYTLIWTCTGIGIICFIYFCAKRKCFPLVKDDPFESPIVEPVDDKPIDFGNRPIEGDFNFNNNIKTRVHQNLNPTYNVGVYRDEKGRFRSIKDYYTTSTFV